MRGKWLPRGGWRLRGALLASSLAIVLGSGLAATAPAGAAAAGRLHANATAPVSAGWPAYLNGPRHSSYAPAQSAITPASAPQLAQLWHHAPGRNYLASPTVADGAVFIGADGGWFYKLGLTSGAVLAKRFLGFQRHKTCGAFGTVDTATVATDPGDHQPTVYIAGADGYLYALNASNLEVKWKSVIAIPSAKVSNYFDWSSPTVANGRIYIGIASNCDQPLVHAGLISYNLATGKKLAEFYTTPKGDVGGSIWSSVAVAPDGDVFATTGNGPEDHQLLGYSESILKLSPRLRLLGRFQVPASQVSYDADFGASPVLFGRYVGACDKNGIFYAVRQSTMKLAWDKRVSGASSPVTGCIAAAAYDGHHLFIGGLSVTIRGRSYRGSIQERDPGNGKLVWETGLPDGVIGSPSLDGGGVVAVGTYDISSAPCATYLVGASDGKILRKLVTGMDFSQSVFADNMLFSANDNGVYAWQVKPS
ncbi:MAG TPA: PQQ-binding-like beta-propeller repeat protein [Streptosporangiaceae bacterium]|nr:PQQ-binding-like beta-propeller repeat protein [Streptosporangiaceae bacterium]